MKNINIQSNSLIAGTLYETKPKTVEENCITLTKLQPNESILHSLFNVLCFYSHALFKYFGYCSL